MKKHLKWQYDESKQIGKDYSEPAEVDMYDSSHSKFRDIAEESNIVLDSLGVGDNDVLIDFGSGTGTFAIQAALRGAMVYAIDVSQPCWIMRKPRLSRRALQTVLSAGAGSSLLNLKCKLKIRL